MSDATEDRRADAMAERIRAFDWATTELGPVTTWPASLVTTVDLVTAAAAPMLVWWGAQSTQIYNDAARRALIADHHPRALGTPAAHTWGRAWRDLAASVASVRAGHGGVVREPIELDDHRTWSLSLVPIPDGAGGVGGVLAIGHELPRELSFVDLCRDHLRELFMHAPTPIGIVRGPQYVIELSNEAMAATWGVTVADSLGRPVFDIVPARALFEPILVAVKATGESRVLRELQYRVEDTADGQRLGRYANILFAPIRDVHGKVDAVLISGADITDEVRARDEARRLRGVAEAANRAKDEFLAILGHELRNPLAPISTALKLLAMRGVVGRELEVIERQVGHLTRLVDDLLDISRTRRGKVELHRRDIELSVLVREALEVTSPLLEQFGDLVEVVVPPRGLGVYVDRERIVQVVTNLITNAAKYSAPGSSITIRGARVDDMIHLSIRDPGVGIAPEMLEHIFEPFVQQRQTSDRAQGGLGLGLAIARSLVEQHGGTISAVSEGPGHGSEFTIALPSSTLAAAASPGEGARPREVPAIAPGMKILVVDDNADAAMLMADALEVLGYRVALAHDGPSALRLAEAFDPDVALLDLGLPVMDGFELAQRLRAQQPPQHPLHLVAVTGYGQESDRQRSRSAGFERHLVKPVSMDELSRVVTELVA